MSLLMPVLARWDIKGLIVARVLQGFIGVSAAIDFSHLRINWWVPKYQVYTGVRRHDFHDIEHRGLCSEGPHVHLQRGNVYILIRKTHTYFIIFFCVNWQQ